jgi:hypothetical protein
MLDYSRPETIIEQQLMDVIDRPPMNLYISPEHKEFGTNCGMLDFCNLGTLCRMKKSDLLGGNNISSISKWNKPLIMWLVLA